MRRDSTGAPPRPRWLAGLVLAWVAPALALGMWRLPGSELGPPYLLFTPLILIAALLGGPWSGFLSTVLSAAIAAAWVLSADGGARDMTARDAVGLAAFVVSGLLVSLLAHLHRKARDRAAAAERTAALRETSARLEDSEERLRRTRRDAHMTAAQLAAVINGVQEGISLVDRAGRFVLMNPAQARVLGFDGDGNAWADLTAAAAVLELSGLDGLVLPPDGWPTARVLRGEAFVDWELRARRRDTGREAIVSCSGEPIRGDGGEVQLALVVMRDVTEERRSRDALRRSEARFRALIEKSTDMLLVLDAEGRITFWSPSTTEAVGWREDEAIGRHALDWVHPEERERAAAVLGWLLARPGAREHALLRHHHADGSWRTVELSARNLLQDPAVRGVVVNGRDVTAQRALEHQLRQAQKLESVGCLAGGVAHDFNNLLTVILAGVAELRQSPGNLADVAEVVEEIGAAGDRARELTQQLLAFARKQATAPVSLDLGDVVQGTERLLRRLLGEGLVLTTRFAPDLWPVRCDRGQAEQIVLNLAVNARDAMPAGGRLSIETANVELGEDAAGAGRRPGQWVRLAVSDDGEGMTPEVKERIFEPFFTTKEIGKGTGLGLSTVYGIVAQSGGFIQVESEPGHGACFEVHLPRAAEAVPTGAPALEEAPRGGTEAILVVEDDAQVRAVIVRILRAAGYHVLVAAGGEEALLRSAREPGRIDLLVTDVVMPGLRGRELAERLTAERADLRVLYVSGYTQGLFAGEGGLGVGADLLPKPFSPAALLARVRARLDVPAPARQSRGA